MRRVCSSSRDAEIVRIPHAERLVVDVLSGRLGGRGPALYVWLHLLAGRARVVRTSAARLSSELGFRRAEIRRSLEDLERAGYIRVEWTAGAHAPVAIEIAG